MAKFDRKVERQKSKFTFTKKQENKKSGRFDEFKENFSIAWIPNKWSSFLIIALNFIFVTIVMIPLLMRFYSLDTALILGHGAITSLLIVMTFYTLTEKDKLPKWSALFIRYCFMATILGIFAVVAVLVL